MNTKEALEQYNNVVSNILSSKNKKRKKQDNTFKALTLEAEIKRIVTVLDQGSRVISVSSREGRLPRRAGSTRLM